MKPSNSSIRKIVGKKGKPEGRCPAIALIDPKYPHNVAEAVRAASCFGAKQVWFTGNRVKLEDGHRLPREERMKGYASVDIYQHDYVFDQFPNATPVAVEITPTSEVITFFEHPENALYIFGPEDGSIPQVVRQHCHKFIVLPTNHCSNLAGAIYMTLFHRRISRQLKGVEAVVPMSEMLQESRVWTSFTDEVGSPEGRVRNKQLGDLLCDKVR